MLIISFLPSNLSRPKKGPLSSRAYPTQRPVPDTLLGIKAISIFIQSAFLLPVSKQADGVRPFIYFGCAKLCCVNKNWHILNWHSLCQTVLCQKKLAQVD